MTSNSRMEDDDFDDDNTFEVAKIEGKRMKDGKLEYFIRWKCYLEKDNSWESIDNLQCPELIAKFEENKKWRAGIAERERNAPKLSEGWNKIKKTGFDDGLEPEEITGAINVAGEVIYFMKWKDVEKQGLVPSDIAKEKCPQLVIKFMESHLETPGVDDGQG